MDVASLVFEIDSSSAVAAEKNLDRLTKAADRVETSARKVRTASEMAGIGIAASGSASGRATKSATEHASALGTVERAALRAARAAETRATSEILAARNSDFRSKSIILQAKEEAAATASAEKERAAAWRQSQAVQAEIMRERVALARASAREEAAAAREVSSLTNQYNSLRATLDPMAAVQTTLTQRTTLLDTALAKGAITADQHAVALSQVTRAALGGVDGIGRYAGGLKNGGQYATQFSFQLNDIVTGLASGQKPMQIFAQQGGQIFQILQMAAAEAGSFKGAIQAMLAQIVPLIAAFAPWIAGIAAVSAGLFILWKRHEDAKKKATELTKEIQEMTKALEKSVPSLVDSANSSALAADGAKNFENWLDKSNQTLATYAERLKAATVNQYMLAAAQAATSASELRSANTNQTSRAVVYTGGGGSKGLADYLALQKQADENSRLAAERAKKALDAPLSAFQDPKTKASASPRDQTAERSAQLDAALAQARADELQARMSLTKDIQARADLEKQVLAEELAKKQADLARQAANIEDDKGLSAAKKQELLAQLQTVEGLEKQTSAHKAAAIDQELSAQLLQAELASRQVVNTYLDKMAGYASEQATTEAERNAIELASLKRRQGEEAYALAASNALKVSTGEINAMAAAEADLRQRNLAFAETESTLRKQAIEVQKSAFELDVASKEAGIALLASQADLASTAYERGKIELEILKAQHEIERLKLEEIVQSAASTENEKAIANARLGVLAAIQKNEVEAAKRGNSLIDAFSSAVNAANDMARAFKSGDIGGAISGFASTLKNVSGLLGSTSKLGGSLGGIASWLGPIGGLVSSVTSLFGGLFGGSSKKKKERQAAEEAARQAALERAAQVADEHRTLEIALMEAQGDAAGALAAKRADELAKIDASNCAMQEQLWALEDAAEAKAKADALAAEAAQKAADIAATRHGLEIDLLEAMGRTDEASKMRVADQRAALDESLRGLFDQIQAERELTAAREAATAATKAAADLRTAQQSDAANLLSTARANLKAAYDAQVSEIKAGRDQMQGYAQSFREFRMGLSGATASGADFYRIAAKARLGDADAMGQLVGAAQAADTSARSGASTQLEYLREQTKIRAAVQAAEDTATRQASIADKQLAALEAQVSGFITLNESTLTVAAGISAVVSAINTLNMTFGGAMSNPGRDWGRNPDSNQALARQTGYSGDFGGGGFQKWIEQQSEATKATARDVLSASGQSYRIAFAEGGAFTNGIVRRATDFDMGRMGEAGPEAILPLVQTSEGLGVRSVGGDDNSELVDELRALRAEVAALRSESNAGQVAIAKNTGESARIARRWDGDGLPPEREVAA